MSFNLTRPIVFILTLSASFPCRADIVGGQEVKPNDPVRSSIAALYTPNARGPGGALCTASVIGDGVAITAAHCVQPGGPKPVLIFGSNLKSPDSTQRAVTAMRVNPKWETHQGKGMDQGDVALVKFKGGIPTGYRPIETLQSDSALKKGKVTTLAGYGISDAKTHAGAGVLRKAKVQVLSPRLGKTEMILDQRRGKGACHGDSGGPAYIRQRGKVVLAGVTNRGYPNNAPDDCAHKVVYTKVSAYQPWIKKEQASLQAQKDLREHFKPKKTTKLRLFSSCSGKRCKGRTSETGKLRTRWAKTPGSLGKSPRPRGLRSAVPKRKGSQKGWRAKRRVLKQNGARG